MVQPITMNKHSSLGYIRSDILNDPDMIRLAGRWKLDVWMHMVYPDMGEIEIYILERKPISAGRYAGQRRVVANLTLEKEKRFWNTVYMRVDSCYQGRGLSKKLYKFLIKRGLLLMAGHSQSPGGQYIWNELAKDNDVSLVARKSPYSRVLDFPVSGEKRLSCESFDLYDSKAEIYAVAS